MGFAKKGAGVALLATALTVQPIPADYFHHADAPHRQAEVSFSEPRLSFAVPSVSGAEVSTIAHFECPRCGGELGRIFPGMFRENGIRHRLLLDEAWCDAGRCDWHGRLTHDFLLRLSYGQWVKTTSS